MRIGYISGDLNRHPVGRVLQAVLPHHDRAQMDVFCYANQRMMDDVSRRIQSACHRWQGIQHLTDSAITELIRADQIDILVDLSGHTGSNRLLVLARKPAPIQALWLGYFDTTGMASMDYIFADRYVCPVGHERYFVEQVVRLPDSWFCYSPPDSCPEVAMPPLRASGRVTFGCLNNLAKLTPEVIALWARILRAVPGASLILKAFGLDDASVRQRYLEQFGAHGVSRDRIVLRGRTSLSEHMAAYREIDIALDPFPYNGGITTLDALWMGTPVISLAGDRFVGRLGVSILSTVGLTELIAPSADAYAAMAISLAREADRLVALRESLRHRMAASPLCDGPRFARGLDGIYRQLWRAWCQSRRSRTPGKLLSRT